jgi:DNA-binding NarL/FixJ family response regulator
MPTLYGVETASSMRDVVPDTKIIGLAMFDGEFRKSHLAAAGFDMIVSKQAGLGKLAEAISALLSGS